MQALFQQNQLGVLRSQRLPPIALQEPLPIGPAQVWQISKQPLVYIVDTQQNMAGIVSLRVWGQRNDTVKMRYGEVLYPDGTLNVMTSVAGQVGTLCPCLLYAFTWRQGLLSKVNPLALVVRCSKFIM